MVNSGSLLGVLGIFVSVILFLIGYRQTVGAKKERIGAANTEVEKILVRRLVLEGYTPKIADLERLAEGKARDFRVRRGDLLPEEELLNLLFTRIIESDLIPHDRRDELLKRIMPSILEAEGDPIKDSIVVDIQTQSKALISSRSPAFLMALAASIVGAVISIIPSFKILELAPQKLLPLIIGTATASLAMIMSFVFFKRVKDSQESTSQVGSLERYVQFERDVAQLLEKKGLAVRPSGPDVGFDFSLEAKEKKILIEVKTWTRPLPQAFVGRVVERLQKAIELQGADQAIIVTPSFVPSLRAQAFDSKIRIMTIREFKKFLTQIA